MNLELTPQEFAVVEFALTSDLETVENAIKDNHGNPEWAEEAMHIRRVLAKMEAVVEGMTNDR